MGNNPQGVTGAFTLYKDKYALEISISKNYSKNIAVELIICYIMSLFQKFHSTKYSLLA